MANNYYFKVNKGISFTPQSLAPATAKKGDLYFDNILNLLQVYNGTSWDNVGGGGEVLTIGTGLTGGSYDGTTPVTITIDSTVATLSGSQTLTNKSVEDDTFSIVDATDNTKTLKFDVTSANSGYSTTIQTSQQASNIVLALPEINDTLVGKITSDTFQNKKFNAAINGNELKINGTEISNTTGIASNTVVLNNEPTINILYVDNIYNKGTTGSYEQLVLTAIDESIYLTTSTDTNPSALPIIINGLQLNSPQVFGNPYLIYHPAESIEINSTSTIRLDGTYIDLTNKNIKNLANPTLNQDAATKQYVDAYYSGTNTSLASGAQITLQSGRIDQIFSVISSSGNAISLSTTPFTISAPGTIYNGTTIMLIGKSETATVQLTHNDATNGCVLNGNAVLGLNDTITLRYVGDRYFEVSRNF